VMVCGGGDGVGGLGAVAKAVILKMGTAAATSGKRSQVIVICGKNEAVKHDIESGPKPAGVNVVVLGFVKNMDEWMGAVDVIVTKVSVITCVSLWCIKYYIALTHQIAVQYRDVCMTLTVLCIAKP
jgi:processive 1,2-diacylglycerol beta-glucosyltransferase